MPLAVGFIATHLLLVAAILWMIRRREKHRR
jgi:hypothetical protein